MTKGSSARRRWFRRPAIAAVAAVSLAFPATAMAAPVADPAPANGAFACVIDLSDSNASTGSGDCWTRSANLLYTILDDANVLVIGSSAGAANPVSRIQVGGGNTATLTLRDATIDLGAGTFVPLAVNDGAHLDLILDGANVLTAGGGGAALQVPASASVTISGGGSLQATGGSSGAGIGGRTGAASGAITIESGTINATGGTNAAGIGGGSTTAANGGTAPAGSIVIVGGNVTATATGVGGAGIGGGANNPATQITITGGTVSATSIAGGAGIGGGVGFGANVTIIGGNVTAHAIQSTTAANAARIPQAIGAGAPTASLTPTADILVALPASALNLDFTPSPVGTGVFDQAETLVTFEATAALPSAIAMTIAGHTVSLGTALYPTALEMAFLLEGIPTSTPVTFNLPLNWELTSATLTVADLLAGNATVEFENVGGAVCPAYIDLGETTEAVCPTWTYDPVTRIFTVLDGADVVVTGTTLYNERPGFFDQTIFDSTDNRVVSPKMLLPPSPCVMRRSETFPAWLRRTRWAAR
ncbi:MAG: hypothetical protein FWD83_06235 [Promicromonosporaceae bacterium]|nr:hypothetical protein [Promicromonosporaceae bacterium]